MTTQAASVGRALARAEQERVRRFVKSEYWRLAQLSDRFAYTRAPLNLRSHELPRNSGEVAAVHGPTTLAGGDESLTDEHE